MKSYTPIACHLYDELEIAAMRRQDVVLDLQTESGRETLTDKIVDLWARDGVEYMKLASGKVFRLDHIFSMNGRELVDEAGNALTCSLRG